MGKTGINDSWSIHARDSSREDLRLFREDEFRKILTLERKRSERSLKPLLLLLIDVSSLKEDPDGNHDPEALLQELAGLIREIDFCGWHHEGEIMGALFAEIPVDAVAKAKVAVTTKILARLSILLPSAVCNRITLTFHLFPEKYDGGGVQDSLDQEFYPESVAGVGAGSWAQIVKRGMDIIGSLAALVLFLPFFIIIPLLVKLTSPGPIFFRQDRLGQFGSTFKFLKFRSMHINNDDAIHRQFIKNFIADKVDANGPDGEPIVHKIQRDPRLTPIGFFLRKTSIDELPQFINVLKGDMSLVGPRPPIPYEVMNYEPWHRCRVMAVKPGITGLWQVTGRSLTSFDGMVRLDLRYSRTRSLWLDIKLLLATPLAVIRGKGAC